GLDREQGVDAMEECLRARLIADAGTDGTGEARFTHGLVREVIYSTLSTPRRAGLHQSLPDTLEGRDLLGDRSAVVARHLRLAPATSENLSRRTTQEREAGLNAMRRVAFEAAATHLLEAVGSADASAAPPELLGDLLVLAAKPLSLTGHPA